MSFVSNVAEKNKTMETRMLFHSGDELELLCQDPKNSFFYKGFVNKTRPLVVEITSSLDEAGLQKLQKANELIVAYVKKGYAYKAKVSNMSGNTMELSLIERHELREFFRVNTVIGFGYEVIRRAPTVGGAEAEKENDIERMMMSGTPPKGNDDMMAQIMLGLYQEVRKLRQQVQKSTKLDTSQITQRLVSLSGSGVRFITSVEHNKGDVLRIHMVLGSGRRPLTGLGRIIRVESEFSASDGPSFAIAVQFQDMADADREALVRYVFQTQRNALKRRFGGGGSV